jgi:hypothetical protein
MPDDPAASLERMRLLDEPVDVRPSAEGILCCLHLLAEEAAELGLKHTLDALQRAMGACAVETMAVDDTTAMLFALERPAASRLN